MKILYVCGMGKPLEDILTGKTTDEVTHSPGFFHPWHRLVTRGHQVDFVMTSNFNSEINIKVDWFRRENIKANIYDPPSEVLWYRRIPRRISRLCRLAYHVNKAMKEENYDFVMCWSFYEGVIGNIIANIRKIPCGLRGMGTLLYPELKKNGSYFTAMRHPAEFLSYRIKKNFYLMTDDGTHGDKLFHAWRPSQSKYDFLFWKTGISFESISDINKNIDIPEEKYLFFAARFDPWKRHDRIIEILKILHIRGHKIHLYFAGKIQSNNYNIKIRDMVSKLELNDYVHYLGEIKQAQLKLFAYNAIANVFMYDFSNLGNVFFEVFSAGGIIIGLDDGSLDEYINHERNGFIISDNVGAARVIQDILIGKIPTIEISKRAIEDAKYLCLSLDERFDSEVEIIENVVRTGRTGLKASDDGICHFVRR